MGKFPPERAVADWAVKEIGNGLYEIYATFTCTGSAVGHPLTVNFPFELLAIYLQHTVAAGTLSTDALTWIFNRVKATEFPQPFPLVSYTSSAVSNFLELFKGIEFTLPLGSYTFSENSTNTDLVYVRILVKVII